jgi:hypothetical protein
VCKDLSVGKILGDEFEGETDVGITKMYFAGKAF